MMKTLSHILISKTYPFSLLLFAFVVISFSSAFTQNRNNNKFVPGELIVKYEPISRTTVSGEEIEKELREFSSIIERSFRLKPADISPVHAALVEKMVRDNTTEEAILRNISRNNQYGNLARLNLSRKLILQFDESIDIEAMVQHLKTNEGIFHREGFRLLTVSPNILHEKQATPDDPLYRFQYAHEITGAEKAWGITKGNSDVVIAIIDTGIDVLNPDVVGKLVEGFDFVSINRSAYDEWQFIDGEDYFVKDNDPTDTDGHGTHVAGIAAARGFDGYGITGVCPGCSIMPIRAGAQFRKLDDENEEDTVTTSLFSDVNVSEAIFHAVQNGADIVNMSFGGEGRSSYHDELQLADASGVVLIAAAGNDDTTAAFYPAFYQEVLAVGSTNINDEKSDFSNYGTWVDVSAPGSAILSTYPEDLGASVSESQLTINGQEYETTIFTFSGYTSDEGLNGSLVYVGLGREEDLSNPNYKWNELTGNIAYIQRGEITFREKVDRAKDHGAIGVIIFNHQDGPLFGTLGTARDNPVPVLGLTKADGDAILNALDSQTQRAEMQVALLSDMHTYNSGTSMAAPYVAGMAGLLLSEEPDLSPDEVKARIKTSVDLLDQLNPQYVGQLGTGRVNVASIFTPIAPPSGEGELNIYPNPTSGTFKVDLYSTETGEVSVRIFSLIGSLLKENMYEKRSNFWNANLDIGNLPTGIYLVEVTYGDLKEIRKLVKR